MKIRYCQSLSGFFAFYYIFSASWPCQCVSCLGFSIFISIKRVWKVGHHVLICKAKLDFFFIISFFLEKCVLLAFALITLIHSSKFLHLSPSHTHVRLTHLILSFEFLYVIFMQQINKGYIYQKKKRYDSDFLFLIRTKYEQNYFHSLNESFAFNHDHKGVCRPIFFFFFFCLAVLFLGYTSTHTHTHTKIYIYYYFLFPKKGLILASCLPRPQ